MTDTNEHHGIPQSRGGSDNFINVKPINRKQHDAYHQNFGNCIPTEAIAQIIMQHRDIFRDEFVEALARLLSTHPSEVYESQAFVNDDAIERLQREQKGGLRRLLQEIELLDEEPVFVLKFPSLPYSRKPA